jgi:geranylgeranylglycerol-phosphate geranylgeranyltransferase
MIFINIFLIYSFFINSTFSYITPNSIINNSIKTQLPEYKKLITNDSNNFSTYKFMNKFSTQKFMNKFSTQKLFMNKFSTHKFMYPFNIIDDQINTEEFFEIIKLKIKSFLELIRYENILPTILLNFSGGWIANPSLTSLLHSPPFIISIITTILIMTSSMIINDIIDIDIDKINSPNKPLVNGSIKINEAYGYLIILLTIAELLSYNYFTQKLQIIIHLAILNIILYTPVFKKIPFIKNISCAFLVSFSVIFSSFATGTCLNQLLDVDFKKNAELLKILFLTLFYGSFYNELLLDICDKEGDEKNNIKTIPVIYGNKFSINLLLNITNAIIIFNTFLLKKAYRLKVALLYPIIFLKSYINLLKIKNNNYLKSIIMKVVKNTNIILFILLLYMCILAKL